MTANPLTRRRYIESRIDNPLIADNLTNRCHTLVRLGDIATTRSFVDLNRTFGSQPVRLGALLGRIDVGRGREGLFRDQLPQLLDALAKTTRVESITASSAIEGVVVDAARIQGLAVQGVEPARFRNRNEREFAGYRDAMDEISRATDLEAFSSPTCSTSIDSCSVTRTVVVAD